MKHLILAAAFLAGSAFGQSTTTSVSVPYTVPSQSGVATVNVTVTPTTVTIGSQVIPVPTSGGTSPPGGGTTNPPATGSCSRSGTGTGLYVACGRLNNPDGTEFRIRGVNRAHVDQGAVPGLALAGANTSRSGMYPYLGGNATSTGGNDVKALNGQKIVTVLGAWDGTCKTDTGSLQTAVNHWVNDKSTWLQFNGTAILNIANEWGPGNSTAWRDANISAIQQVRAAGYTMPIMIDTGDCGKDQGDLLNYGAAVAQSDPEHNVVFGYHEYGGKSSAQMHTLYAQFAALSKSNPALAFVIGEFGPCCGLDGIAVQPGDVIATAEGNNLGWLAWAWDDNNLANCQANDAWFDMKTSCAQYNGDPSQLTAFGKIVVGQFTALRPAKAKVF